MPRDEQGTNTKHAVILESRPELGPVSSYFEQAD
jgi:hypothetical protein